MKPPNDSYDIVKDPQYGGTYQVWKNGAFAHRVTMAFTGKEDDADLVPIACTCAGYNYRSTCRHLNLVAMKLADDGVDYWDCMDCSALSSWESVEEAVIEFLDNYVTEDPLPLTVEVAGWRKVVPVFPKDWGKRLVQKALEHLDEVYGDPEGDPTDNTSTTMDEAAELFITTILGEYDGWRCDVIVKKEVNLRGFIAKGGYDASELNLNIAESPPADG